MLVGCPVLPLEQVVAFGVLAGRGAGVLQSKPNIAINSFKEETTGSAPVSNKLLRILLVLGLSTHEVQFCHTFFLKRKKDLWSDITK